MKRKKQLLSWILSFLMVFSIMPMVSISAFASTYDVIGKHHVGENVYPGDVIKDSISNVQGMRIKYYNSKADHDADWGDNFDYDNPDKYSEVSQLDASTGYTILSSEEANLTAPDGYVLDYYNINDIYSSSSSVTQVYLIANWKKVNKITYDMTNITVSKIDVVGEKYDIGGETYVTSGSAVTISIEADTGYKLPDTITVEMGGNVLENSDYEYDQATGEITVYDVTKDVKITAVGVEEEKPPTPPVTTAPGISFGEVSSIGKTSATIKSSITLGLETIINQGFEWKETDGGTYVQKTGTLNNGILTATLTGLSKNTRYTVRPFVVTETKTYYGAEKTFRTKKSTSSGSSSSSSSSSSSGSGSDIKSDTSIVEPTEEAIIKALKTSEYKKIQVNIDSNPNLLLSKAIIEALAANKDKTLIIVSNNVSTNISINENDETKFTRNGSVLTGFVSVFNSEYYSNNNGIVQKGWVPFSGDSWYYFDKETGIRGKSWIKDNGNWYYLNQLGLMQTGWIKDNGVWYYSDKSSGRMLASTTIDGYVLGSSGAWIG